MLVHVPCATLGPLHRLVPAPRLRHSCWPCTRLLLLPLEPGAVGSPACCANCIPTPSFTQHETRTGNPHPPPSPPNTLTNKPPPRAIISKETSTVGFPRASSLLSLDYQVDMLRICDVEADKFIHVVSHIIISARVRYNIWVSRDRNETEWLFG